MNIKQKISHLFRPNDPTGEMSKAEGVRFGVSGFGQNMVVAFLSGMIMIFFTDVLLISAVAVAFIILGVRLFDAVTDPLFATIFDRTRSRWGKLRPYLLLSPIPIVILTVLNFTYWGFTNPVITIVVATLVYALWSVAYTIKDVPYWAMSAAITSDAKKRTWLLTFARLTCSAGAGLVSLAVPLIVGWQTDGIRAGFMEGAGGLNELTTIISQDAAIYGTAFEAHELFGQWEAVNAEMAAAIQPVLARAFFWTVLIAMIPALIMMFLCFFTNERVMNETKPQSVKHSLGLLFKNKPILQISVSGIVGSLRGLNMTMLFYFATYNLRNPGFAGFPGILLVVPGGLIAALLTPLFCKKFGKRATWVWSHLLGGVIGVAMWFIALNHPWVEVGGMHAWQMALFITGSILLGFPMGFSNVLTYAMIGDTVDYLDLKTGERAEGICFAAQTFISKIGMAMTAFVGLLILGVSDFVPNEIQDGRVLSNLWMTMTLFVGISTLLCVLPLIWYKLTERHQKLAAELIAKRNDARKTKLNESKVWEDFDEDYKIDIIKQTVQYPKSLGGKVEKLSLEELESFKFETNNE
jgi:Na+/melibiose symporter-like transporter